MSLDEHHARIAPPNGFRPVRAGGKFIQNNGPIFVRRVENEVTFGFRVEEGHCNPMGMCHGGWLATIADITLPLIARVAAGLDDTFLLTVSLSLDYLAPAPLGAWVEGSATLLRRTKRMVFAQGILTVEGEAVLRASGIFRLGPPSPPLQL